MDIRRLDPQDAPDYQAVRVRALWEYPDAFTSSYEEDIDKPIEAAEKRLGDTNRMFWGAFVDGHLCGMVGLERETRTKNRHKAHVVGMYVMPEQAGGGIARALLDALLAQARESGVEVLVLTVTQGNKPAQVLYESVGFHSFGVEPRAIKVDGRYHAKNHMVLELNPRSPL